jgi:hypothetical protein
MPILRGQSPTVQRFINSMNFSALNAARSAAVGDAVEEGKSFNSKAALQEYLKSYMQAYFMNKVPQNRNYNTEIKLMEQQITNILNKYPLELTNTEKQLIAHSVSPVPSNSGSIVSTESSGSSGLNRVISLGTPTTTNNVPVIKGGKRKHRTKRLRKHRTKRRT